MRYNRKLSPNEQSMEIFNLYVGSFDIVNLYLIFKKIWDLYLSNPDQAFTTVSVTIVSYFILN